MDEFWKDFWKEVCRRVPDARVWLTPCFVDPLSLSGGGNPAFTAASPTFDDSVRIIVDEPEEGEVPLDYWMSVNEARHPLAIEQVIACSRPQEYREQILDVVCGFIGNGHGFYSVEDSSFEEVQR